jgi:hypothetical protein
LGAAIVRVRPDLDGRFRVSCASRDNPLTGVDDHSRSPEMTKAAANAVPERVTLKCRASGIFDDREHLHFRKYMLAELSFMAQEV